MSLARPVVTAVVVEGRSKSAVARDYRGLLAEGETALQPRSRRPHTSPNRTPRAVEDEIVALRKELDRDLHEAGAATIAYHLEHRHDAAPAVSTIWRILTDRGFVVPQPHKRPKSSWRRFVAEMPSQRWQLDITHWRLAGGPEVEILNIVDDRSRLCLASRALAVFTADEVTATFTNTAATYGNPAELLSDNGAAALRDRGYDRTRSTSTPPPPGTPSWPPSPPPAGRLPRDRASC